jgi:tRNA A-37 threonylcarbamoyl transferase component Bud32
VGFFRRFAHALGRPLPAGPRIGRYRVIRRLAEGGMGEIFLARSGGRGGFEKLLVLKRLHQQRVGDREAVKMFMDEARLMATLDHANIVQVHDFGAEGGADFLTMEYVHGEDVGRIMKAATLARRPLSMEMAIGVIAEAAAGLHYAHERTGDDGHPLQIVHRDISPSNILVSYEGAVKVADFGIAKWSRRETETRTGGLKGKIAYMSPEQCRSGKMDRRSDVFSLGIVLFELTTGTRLYQGTSDFGILEQIVNHDVPRPSSRRAHYPPALETIVLKALARDPEQRYQSARELQLALEELALEGRMKTSAVNRAAEMTALFGGKIGAWREAEQAGLTLGEHLARAPEVTRGASSEDGERTITRVEGNVGGAVAGRPAPRLPVRRVAVVGLAVLGLGSGAWALTHQQVTVVMRPPPSARAAVPPSPAGSPPRSPPASVHIEAPSPAPAAPETAVIERPPDPAPVDPVEVRSPPVAVRRPDRRPHAKPSPAGPAKSGARAAARIARSGTRSGTKKGSSPATARPPRGKKVWDPDSIYLP